MPAPVRHHAVQVPATSANLGAGFDAFGLALDLHLWARTVDRSAQAERVVTDGDGYADVATGDDNLVWRCLVAFCETHDVAVPDVALRVVSEVPLERGLGSSSAAIVAGLALARAVTGVAVGDRDLVTLADRVEGHPDNVAPALLGGLVACVRRDDGGLVVRRVNPTPRLRLVALIPNVRHRTELARTVLPDQLVREAVADQAARAGHVLAALTGTWPVAPEVAGDRLHEPPRLAVMDTSGALVTALRRAGVHAWLSGAGPTVLAALPSTDPLPPEAEAVAGDRDVRVQPLRVDLAGALVCPEDGCALAGTGGCVQCPRRRV